MASAPPDAGPPPAAPGTRRTIQDWPALLRRCAELNITAQGLGIEEENLEVALAAIVAANTSPAWKLAERNKLKKTLQRAIYDAEMAPPPPTEGGSRGRASSLELPMEELIAEVLASQHDPTMCLGLARGASAEQMRKRYHGLLLRLHPDKCDHAQAKQATQAVEEAYRKLFGG